MLGRICIINAPMVFKAVWQLIKPMLNPRTLNKIQVGGGPNDLDRFERYCFCTPFPSLASPLDADSLSGLPQTHPPCHPQICQSNYTADLLEWVDADNLPVWLGGRSKGTLLDDVGPWSDPDVLHRLEPDLPAAAGALRALRRDSMAGGAGGSYLEGEGGDGYQSPRCAGFRCESRGWLLLWLGLCLRVRSSWYFVPQHHDSTPLHPNTGPRYPLHPSPAAAAASPAARPPTGPRPCAVPRPAAATSRRRPRHLEQLRRSRGSRRRRRRRGSSSSTFTRFTGGPRGRMTPQAST
jgi:hypothetical protein